MKGRTMRMMTVLLIAITFASGCGSDGGGSSGSSGVSGSKKGSDLTKEEQQSVCDWGNKLYEGLEPSTDETCTYLAAESADDEASCKRIAADCAKAGKDENGDLCVETSSGSSCIGPDEDSDKCHFERCGATVSEIEACVRDFVDANAMDFANRSCADAGKNMSDSSEAVPESCKGPFKTCPSLFE